MVWTEHHNEMLIREMYLLAPWEHKKGSPQRGNVWEQISCSLNDLDEPKFNVTQKSVRDHYNLLERQQKKRIRDEEKASGISPEHTEFEDSMEDIISLFLRKDEEDQKNDEEKKEKSEVEAAQVSDMKHSAMESFAQSQKRKGQDQERKRKRKMSNGSDTIAYLQQRYQVDSELRKEELKLKQEELNERKAERESSLAQQEALANALKDTIVSQQRQQEQLLQQMQVQNAALIGLMQQISKK